MGFSSFYELEQLYLIRHLNYHMNTKCNQICILRLSGQCTFAFSLVTCGLMIIEALLGFSFHLGFFLTSSTK